jgi:hypothetical protein
LTRARDRGNPHELGDGLQGFVEASTRGPLCISSCADNVVWDFIYVSNGNELTSVNDGQFRARDTLSDTVTTSSKPIFMTD